jgi:autotransporter-associated beta strand protein
MGFQATPYSSSTVSNALNLNGGTLLTGALVGTGTASNTVNFNGGLLAATGYNLSFLSGMTNAYVLAGGARIDDGGNQIGISQNLLSGATHDGGLTKSGAGTLILYGSNSYNGGTTVQEGVLQVANSSALGTGGLTANGGTLDLAGFSIAVGNLSGAAGTITDLGSNAEITTLTVHQSTNSTFGGQIVDGPLNHLALSVTGTGKLTISGSSNYSGGTQINAGTLQFAKTSDMPSSGTVTVAGGATLAVNAGGVDEFTNATSGSGSIGGLLAGIGGQGAPVIWNAGAKLGIDTTNAGGSFTYAGVIANTTGGSLGLTKLGTGSLVLTASNTYTGGTTVSGGTLIVTHPWGLADGSSLTIGNPLAFAAAPTVPSTASTAGAAAAVPEPGTLALLAAVATAGWTVWRRRRSKC